VLKLPVAGGFYLQYNVHVLNNIMNESIRSITHKAIKSTKWVFLATILSKASQPVVTVILTHLLIPNDFGLMAIATIVMCFMNIFQDIGLGSALIQRKDKIEESANVIFWTNIGLGIFWFLLIFSAAPYIAIFFDNKNLTSILRVMGLVFLISPIGYVQLIFLSKEMEFRSLFYFDIIPVVVPGIVSVILAYVGYGVWALVYGLLSGKVLTVLIVWYLNDWRPGLKYSLNILKDLLWFGSYVSIESIQIWILNTIDNVFVGRFLNVTQLGIYSMGFNIAFLPLNYILSPISRVLFPTFSKLQDNLEDIKMIFLRLLKFNALISFPLGLFLFFYADNLVSIFLGENWLLTIPVVKLLAPYGMISSVVGFSNTVYRSIGRPDIMPKFYTIRLFISVPAYYFATQNGLLTLCVTHLLLSGLFAPVNFYIIMKVLGIRMKAVIEIFRDVVICCIISATIGHMFTVYISSRYNTGDVVLITSFILVFGSLYILLLKLIGRETYGEMKKILRIAIT